MDPLAAQYPNLTPYQFASNTPIMGVDLDGLELDVTIMYDVKNEDGTIQTATATQIADETGGFTGRFAEFAGQAGVARKRYAGYETGMNYIPDADARAAMHQTVRLYENPYGQTYAHISYTPETWGEWANRKWDSEPVRDVTGDGRRVGIQYSAFAGAGTTGEIGIVLILHGPDAGTFVGFSDFGVGLGNDISLSATEGRIDFLTDDPEQISASLLSGRRTSVGLGFDLGLSASLDVSISDEAPGVPRVRSTGGSIGIGITPISTGVSGSVNRGNTSTTYEDEP